MSHKNQNLLESIAGGELYKNLYPEPTGELDYYDKNGDIVFWLLINDRGEVVIECIDSGPFEMVDSYGQILDDLGYSDGLIYSVPLSDPDICEKVRHIMRETINLAKKNEQS